MLVTLAVGCGSSTGSTTAPSSTPAETSGISLNGTVTGTCFFGCTIDPGPTTVVAGASVIITDGPNAGKSTTADSQGRYGFTGLLPGFSTFTVSANKYLAAFERHPITSSQTLDFVLKRDPPVIVLTGQVTDGTTSAPVAGATVWINSRYPTTTNTSGQYRVSGLLDVSTNHDLTSVDAMNYESDCRLIRGTTQIVHLYRIDQMTAGESKPATVAPDDTLCWDDPQEVFEAYVCRTVRVVAPRDGFLTVEALSIQDGAHPV
jgi:hypothetical protein